MGWIGEEGGGRGQSRRGQNADSNRQKQKRGEKEREGMNFSVTCSPPPSDGELRVGAGLGAEEEKTLTTRQRCLEDLPPVPSKVGVYKVKKSLVLQVWPKLYLCGVSLVSQVSPNNKKKKHKMYYMH